ncbi:MAG TPA: transposase [Nitrospiria bacterium]|nr:transposase [Nitrospiria bacterium]
MMKSRYMPEIHHRRSIRLKGYEYSRTGAYFVTVCVKNRECLFGDIFDGRMVLNDAGRIVERVWKDLPARFPSVELDAFALMPNHVHGILALVGAGLALPDKQGAASSAPTLGDVVRTFKSMSAIRVNRLLSCSGQPFWQRNYYEHIIRNDDELNRTREYIQGNPANWSMDENHSDRIDRR